jgi:hypothetical protein
MDGCAAANAADSLTVMQAKKDLLDAVDQMQQKATAGIVIVAGKVESVIADLVTRNAKMLGRIESKILQKATRMQVKADDALNQVSTTVLAGLDSWQQSAHYLLDQLTTKGGLKGIGDDLTRALIDEVTQAPEVAYLGTLVLQVREAIPWLERIAVALERIADATAGAPRSMLEETPEDRREELIPFRSVDW